MWDYAVLLLAYKAHLHDTVRYCRTYYGFGAPEQWWGSIMHLLLEITHCWILCTQKYLRMYLLLRNGSSHKPTLPIRIIIT
jgi:hypothetical protein